ncbi:MAG TPA: PDZ domain-containing protein [Brumimicrobium sp.]|nr:PDZ domain-containing protein [Brumimicrobium sp.]
MKGRTADDAGILAGDIITKIGDCVIKNIYDYMECLSEIEPNDKTTVSFIRNGQELIVNVEFK